MASLTGPARFVAGRKGTFLLIVLLAAEALFAFRIVFSGGALTLNLIRNPSCEKVDAQGKPVAWGFYRSHSDGEWGAWADAASGERGIFITPTSYDPRHNDLLNIGLLPVVSDGYRGDEALALKPDARYCLAFSAKGTVPNVRIGLMVWEATGPDQTLQRRVVSPSVENVFPRWTKYKFVFQTPPEVRKAAPFFQLRGEKESFPEGGVLILDDVDLHQQAVSLAEQLLHISMPIRDPEYAVSPLGVLTWIRILLIAIGLSLLPALLLPIRELAPLERLILGWAVLFPALAVLSLLSHYLRISGFTLTWITLIALAFFLGFTLRSWRLGLANWNLHGSETLWDCAIVLFPGVVLCHSAYTSGAGWLLHYGLDMGDYLGRARMILRSGQFMPIDMGSPYGDHTVSAISTATQAWHAIVAYLSGCDIVYVSLVLSVAMPFIVVAVFYFLLRSAGIGRCLAVPGIPLLFLSFRLLIDYRRYAYNRAVAYLVGLVALACLLKAFQKRGFPNRLALLSCCLFGSLAAIHIPRAGAVFYVFAILTLGLAVAVRQEGAHPLARVWRYSRNVTVMVGIAGLISLLFLVPKTESVLNLFLNPLQIAHMASDHPARFSDYPPWWMAVLFVCGLGLIFAARDGNRELRLRGSLIIGLAVAFAGVTLIHYVYPYAHARNYREAVGFAKPLLLTLPLLLGLEIILARGRRRVWPTVLSLVLIAVVLKPLYTEVRATADIRQRRASGINKLNQRRYLRDHTDILEYLRAREPDSWPRIGGDPSQTQTLTTIANVRPASWRLRLPLKTQLFDFGNVPIMESCHLLNAIDEVEAAIWCKRLKVDYVLDDFGEVQWEARADRFWRTPEAHRLCVVDSASNRLFVPPTAPPGHVWDWYESRVFRFRVDLLDLKADRSPLLLEASCGGEVLPLEKHRDWRRSFIYTFHGERNHKNWGEMETTAGGLVGRRVFGDYATIKRTKNLRSAPFRISFDGMPGKTLALKFRDDHACTLYVELWTGREWLTLLRRRFTGNGEVTQFAVRLPDVDFTDEARFFPRLVPSRSPELGGTEPSQLLDVVVGRPEPTGYAKPERRLELDLRPEEWQVWRAPGSTLDEVNDGGLRVAWTQAVDGYAWFMPRKDTPLDRLELEPRTLMKLVVDVEMNEEVSGEFLVDVSAGKADAEGLYRTKLPLKSGENALLVGAAEQPRYCRPMFRLVGAGEFIISRLALQYIEPKSFRDLTALLQQWHITRHRERCELDHNASGGLELTLNLEPGEYGWLTPRPLAELSDLELSPQQRFNIMLRVSLSGTTKAYLILEAYDAQAASQPVFHKRLRLRSGLNQFSLRTGDTAVRVCPEFRLFGQGRFSIEELTITEPGSAH